MNSNTPLITMVIKSKDYQKIDLLTSSQKSLIETLSMLCSFLSVDDFCSFIFSSKFSDLIAAYSGLVFEIGLYTNHEIVLQLVGQGKKVTIIDNIGYGCFADNSIDCSTDDELAVCINQWLSLVLN